jgi:DHA3 family macrolide efflux protein-like MFS transporter
MFPQKPLAIRAFRNLWLGQAISQFGDAFYYVIFLFMVKKISGSTTMVGVVGAAETLPFLLFSPCAGVLADRIDRRKLMMASDSFSAGILGLFAVLVYFQPSPPAWTLAVTPFALSCARVFFMPAKGAAIPVLVPEESLMAANALSSLTQSIAPMIGLAISMSVLGVLYTFSPVWFFLLAILVNMASFCISALYVRLLPPMVPERKDSPSHALSEFKDGLGYLRRHPVLRVFLLAQAFVSLMIAPFFVVFVEANNRWLGGTPQMLSGMEFTFFIGLVAASSLVSRFRHRRPGLGYAYAVVIIGVCIAGMGYCRTPLGFACLNIICGLAIPFCDVPLTTYIQMEVTDDLRGRVNSVINMIRMGVMPLGMLIGGIVVENAGATAGFLVMGLGMALAASFTMLSAPFRNAEIRDPETKSLAESSLKLAAN